MGNALYCQGQDALFPGCSYAECSKPMTADNYIIDLNNPDLFVDPAGNIFDETIVFDYDDFRICLFNFWYPVT